MMTTEIESLHEKVGVPVAISFTVYVPLAA
jgi:hypothetical protein